jgi:hypothetical protein
MKYLSHVYLFTIIFFVTFTSTANANECQLYPLTLPQSLIENSQSGEQFSKIKLGNGHGNYSWLTWEGSNDAPSLAESLIPPGNSDTYVNPNDTSDHKLDISDWVEGRPGVKNSAAIRTNLSALIGQQIAIPVWSENQGQGSHFNYLTAQFATIELVDFKLNGKGWISFVYIGNTDCDANSAPIAENLTVDIIQASELEIFVNATDADNDELTYAIVTPPMHGSLSGDGPYYIYTPDVDYIGEDSFTFVANDGTVDSNTASVSISVLPAENTPPVAFDISLETSESTSFSFTVNATDAEGDPLNYIIVTGAENGLLVGNGDDGSGPSYTYMPNAGFVGEDVFTFVANDGNNDSNIAVASISIVPMANNPPVANDSNLETTGAADFSLTVDASDADDDPLTYQIVTQPQFGTLSGNGPDYIYTPNPGFVGSDSFSYVANDGSDDSNIGNIYIEVLPAANNPPVANNSHLETTESTAFNLTVDASDADNDPLTYQIVTQPQFGTLSGSGPDYVYTPDPFYVGEDSFSYIANDGSENSNVGSVSIEVLPASNRPPVALNASYETMQSLSVTVNLVATDPDFDLLSYVITSNPQNGVIEFNFSSYTYIPNDGFVGDDSFTFIANDGVNNSNVATISIKVKMLDPG